MKRRVSAILIALALMFGIAATTAEPASATVSTVQTAKRSALFFHTNKHSDRGIWTYSGFGGRGDPDYVPVKGYSELAFVSSFRIPARCGAKLNGVQLWKKKSKGRYANILLYTPYADVELLCSP